MYSSTYQQIIRDIHHIGLQLSLKLPSHQRAIATQISAIQGIRQKLEAIQARVRSLLGRSWRSLPRDRYQRLDDIVSNLMTETLNMELLAEEFAADPEGCRSCLRVVKRRQEKLLRLIQRLEKSSDRPSLDVDVVTLKKPSSEIVSHS